ncbi:DNMBP (predicted) [Pycnogonum litorale]
MKQAYGHYSSNYDEVIALLKKYNSCPGIKAYLDNGVAKIKREQNCFNLASILIMPIQRILKFPLLLNQLKMCTEDDHPDKIELQRAFDLMTDVATTINEAKRRRDLVFKYRRESPSSLSSRLSKLNLHSVKKKSARIGLKLSSTIGIYSATKDESFDECEQRFRFLEKTVKVFLKDVHLFCDQMQECILMQSSLAESIADIYVEKVSLREVNEYRTVQKKIAENYWDEFKLAVANNVCVPINKLQNLFTGPINIIQKRHDKLLDYDNYTSKLEKYKDVSKLKTMKEEQQLAKSNYEALNTQLLDELPMLINASLEILKTCISVFILARKLIIGKITRSMLTLMELPLLVSSKGDIVQNFIMKHNVVAAKIKDIQLSSSKVVLQPVTVNTLSRSKDKGPKPAVRSENTLPGLLNQVAREQLPSERTFVLSKYQPNDIYVMSSAYIASNVMDLSIGAGTIVGVIIRKDPMGSESRWFVDIGHLKGFVTSNSLEPYVPANSGSPPSYNTVVSSGYQQVQSHTDSSLLMSLSPTEESQRRRMSRAVGDFDPLATAGRSVVSANHPSPQDPFSPTVHHNPIANERINNTNVEQAQHGMMRRPTDGTSATTDKTPDNISRFGQPAVPSRLQTGYENISKYDVKLAFGQASHHDYTKPCEDRYDFVSDDVGNDDHRYEVVPEDHRYEIPDDRYDYVSDDVNQQQSEYYYAVFPFSSNGVNMLTLSSGQVVNILHKKDTDGNSDWWFVEDRYGNQGYVPAIYLKPYDL